MKTDSSKKNTFLLLIVSLSVFIPLVVVILYFGPKINFGIDFGFLPSVNATLNGITAMMLAFGYAAVKNKEFELHRRFMLIAIILSVFFLISYLLYHSTTKPAKFGGEGFLKYLYYSLLVSHIFLAMAIVPLVLITYVRALSRRFDKHKKIARITLPLWLYVSVSGFVVYIMISPYYK